MLRNARFSTLPTVLLFLVAALPACARPSPAGPTGSGPAAAPTTKKTLAVAVNKEPSTIQGFTGGGSSAGRGNTEASFVHSQLVVENSDDVLLPELATEVPSTATGTWRINPDSSMDLRWKLRAGVQWHDGTPLTSADLLFTFAVYKDRDLPHPYTQQTRLMESAFAPDPHTLVIHWSRIDVRANEGAALSLLPKHLLENVYQTDKEAFTNSPRFSDEFVGLGPYRLARWERGSHMEFNRFDAYFRGRAPLDSVTVRYLTDPNTMVANVLAGAVDVILPPSIDIDAVAELRRQWEGTGHTVRLGPLPAFLYVEIQYRPELARPARSFTERSVREAFFHATNRQALADVMTAGAAPLADSWVRPGTELRRGVEATIPQYPYDPARAQRLLAEAGWLRGPDGVLVHSQTRERFATDIWANTKAVVAGDKQASIIAQDWKGLGTEFNVHPIPVALANDREYGSKYPTASITRTPDGGLLDRLDSRFIASPANDWSGRNKMAYTNPKVDALLDRFALAVDPSDRVALSRQLVQDVMGDAAFIPLYWEVHPVVMVATVKADIQPNNAGWNAFEWDVRS